MIDPEVLARSLPFLLSNHDSNFSYSLDNTTPDLVKLQLQEQYRSKLQELKQFDHNDLHLLNTQFVDLLFNNYLQSQLDLGDVSLRVPSLTLLSLEDDENFDLEEFVDKTLGKPNYMNLKVLIENSIFDTSKITKDAILSLAALRQLKNHLQEKREMQLYLLNKMTVLHQFIATIVDQELDDPQLLLRILKLYLELQNQLREATREVELAQQKLNNHNLACLVLGYVEDVRLSSGASQSKDEFLHRSQLVPSRNHPESRTAILQLFDSLFSHIVHVAAQRNVSLPPPPSPVAESLELKVKWTQECIDAILATDSNTNTNTNTTREIATASPQKQTSTKTVEELNTALNDLRFSHQYLLKEYELSQDSTKKLVQDYRRKIAFLEAELASSQDVADISYHDNFDSIEQKEKEISRLSKEINMMKIDRVGLSSLSLNLPSGLQTLPFLSTANIAISPVRAQTLPDTTEEDQDEHSSFVLGILVAPRVQGSTSTGILRKEFKKIVTDIQEQYEVKLGEERIRRRKLQEELEKLRKQG